MTATGYIICFSFTDSDLFIQLDKNRHFVEIFSFTRNCNWLDVVEVTFHTGEEPGSYGHRLISHIGIYCCLL